MADTTAQPTTLDPNKDLGYTASLSAPQGTPLNPDGSTQVPPAPTPAPASTVNVNVGGQPVTPQPTQSAQPKATMPGSGSVVDLLNQTGASSSFADRQKLAQSFGIQGYSGTAAQNTDLSKKYLDFYNSKKDSVAPDANPRQEIQDATKTQAPAQDPEKAFIDQYSAMNPVVKDLYDQIHNAVSAPATTQTFTDQYKQLIKDQGIEGLKTDLMNVQNLMKGTENDIRTEIAKAGGFATESQVQALTGARNKTFLAQAQSLQQQLQSRNDYVDQLMKYSQLDRTAAEAQVDKKLGLNEKLATLTDKMVTAAKDNYQKLVDAVGYKGLADSFKGDANGMAIAEKTLGLAPGSLSNPTFLNNQSTKNAPASVQEYEYAKKNGYKGSFSQYQNEDANRKAVVAKAGAPVTSTFTTDENGNVVETGNYDALTIGRYNTAANKATAILKTNPTFKNIIGSSAYLDRIEAAVQNPGSIGDQELLDAFTQLNTGGNRVTEAQVNLITKNQSLGDFMNKIGNKLKTGGALSQDQRNEIVKLSQAVYKKYQDSYKPLYADAAARLQAQGIPKQFWNIPSPETLSRAVTDTSAGGSNYAVDNLKSQLQAGEMLVARENKDGTRHLTAITPNELWATDIKQ